MKNADEFKAVKAAVKKELDGERYQHTIGVAYTCAALAMRYGYSMEDAMLAGLLHDYAKCIPDDEKLKLCRKYGLPVSEVEQEAPGLLHGRLAAYLSRKEFDVKNEEILHAIEFHTTGCVGMNLIDKILYVADFIEPNRKEIPCLEEARRLCFEDIDRGTLFVLEKSVEYVKSRGKKLDPVTLSALEDCRKRG